MSRKPETVFIASVHKYLVKGHPYCEKMNNPYNSGTADVWYSGVAADWWVEYKFITVPKRATTEISPDLSLLQEDWLRERYDEGRRVAVIIGCSKGGVLLLDKTWEQPMSTAFFISKLKTRVELAEWITSVTM